MRRGLVSISLLLAACEPARPVAPPPAQPVASASTAAAPPAATPPGTVEDPPPKRDPNEVAAIEYLQSVDVYDTKFARDVLYTWTSAEQIAELSKTHTLLTRTQSASRGLSWFDVQVEANASIFSRAFRQPSLAKRRFAWTVPWATLRGWVGESYGDRLIRVVLKPDSIIARFDARDKEAWSFQDLAGDPIDLHEAKVRIDKVAAVYHVWSAERQAFPENTTTSMAAVPYREYVLCNESMIAEWSVGTPEIVARVDKDIAMLGSIRSAIENKKPLAIDAFTWATNVLKGWRSPPTEPTVQALWEGAIAFPNDFYFLDAKQLDLVGRAVDQTFPHDTPMRFAPTEKFGGGIDWKVLAKLKPKLPPKPKKPPCRGTMCF